MKTIGSVILSLLCISAYASSDSSSRSINFSGYIETYYRYDFGKPRFTNLSGIVNHDKNNEIAINLALIKASYQSKNIRGNIGLMFGTYAEANFNSTNYLYKYIYESYAGIKLSKSKNIWFDIGIFPSHIGAESVIGKDNWTLSRSLQAEASPYYEAGAKISYTSKNEKLFASILLLNGWQQISKRFDYPMCLGTQITYKPNSKLLINSSSFIGNNNLPSPSTKQRYFHNFYTQFQWNSHLSTFIGFDIGSQQSRFKDNYYELWYSPILLVKYQANTKHSLTFRAEYFRDKFQHVFSTNTGTGYIGNGFSLNYDYNINKNSLFRIEGKVLNAESRILLNSDGYSHQKNLITSTLIFHFDD